MAKNDSLLIGPGDIPIPKVDRKAVRLAENIASSKLALKRGNERIVRAFHLLTRENLKDESLRIATIHDHDKRVKAILSLLDSVIPLVADARIVAIAFLSVDKAIAQCRPHYLRAARQIRQDIKRRRGDTASEQN